MPYLRPAARGAAHDRGEVRARGTIGIDSDSTIVEPFKHAGSGRRLRGARGSKRNAAAS